MTTKMETEEGTKSSFSRVKELHSMFEESLTMCFEVKTIGVCSLVYFVVNYFKICLFFFPL